MSLAKSGTAPSGTRLIQTSAMQVIVHRKHIWEEIPDRMNELRNFFIAAGGGSHATGARAWQPYAFSTPSHGLQIEETQGREGMQGRFVPGTGAEHTRGWIMTVCRAQQAGRLSVGELHSLRWFFAVFGGACESRRGITPEMLSPEVLGLGLN